jgi:hypothetical protein
MDLVVVLCHVDGSGTIYVNVKIVPKSFPMGNSDAFKKENETNDIYSRNSFAMADINPASTHD